MAAFRNPRVQLFIGVLAGLLLIVNGSRVLGVILVVTTVVAALVGRKRRRENR